MQLEKNVEHYLQAEGNEAKNDGTESQFEGNNEKHRDTYEKSDEERNVEFSCNMEAVLTEVDNPNISGFELVFVPVINQQHFYLMCFNLKTSKVELIDNSGVMP
ncbi:hypothetical protein R6Q59_015643 [Mikania micrantha]